VVEQLELKPALEELLHPCIQQMDVTGRRTGSRLRNSREATWSRW
jgi:hypothetical protein